MGIFTEKPTYSQLEEKITTLKESLRSEESDHRIYVSEIKAGHEIERKQWEAELRDFESKKLSQLQEQVTKLTKDLAVRDTQIENLERIINLEGDVVDVKEMLEKVIAKLPEFKINNLQLTAPASSGE